ncbi:hypothetical protein HDU98_005426, partial [Podochytrium sp. JEL0797]
MTLSLAQKLAPPPGKIVFGAWIDTSTGSVSGNDSTTAFNKRIGYNAGSFQIWQDLPPKPIVEATDLGNHNPDGTIKMSVFSEGTNASVFLTVYPLNMSIITDGDIEKLAKQCNEITKSTGRDVFNGDWFGYGQQPTAFIALWQKAYQIITKIAPQVAMVWSPNYNGPPNQEPYDSYWPGKEYVDWVGISAYWKGSVNDYPWVQNKLAPENYVAQLIDAQGPEGGPVSFYKAYAMKYNKPMVISESAGTFHMGTLNRETGVSTPLPVGAGQSATVM